nr:zinc finger, CCHC-type [Tanacetum cinerariifolium]
MTNVESVKDMTSKFDKLVKFEGQDFLRWQKKMHFLLTTLKVMYILSTPSPVWSENETLETTRKRMKWENEDYICRGHMLNSMSDSLFDIYQNAEFAKALWDSLESKYMAEYASATKFLYTQHNLMMDETISVVVIIDKRPPSWKEFKHGLKHKKEKLNLVQLGIHLRIEEGLRNQKLDNNPKGKNQIGSSSVNMVERDGAKNSNNNKNKRKFKSGDDKFANKKGTVTCWKCKKTGHMKKDCRSRKGNDGTGSNRFKDPKKQQVYNSDFMQNFVNVLHYVSVISDAFYVQDDKVAWWDDSGATSHVCKDLRWFQVCKSIEDGSFVKMGNVATEPIKGIGRVLLTFTFGKTLCLDNVLYVPEIQKNLVSVIVLNKCGYKQVLESDKYILSRHGSFIGFGHVYVIEPNDYVSVNSIIKSRDVIFDEERFTSIPRPRGMIQPSSSKIAEDEVEGTDDVPGLFVPRKSTRTRKAKFFGSDFSCMVQRYLEATGEEMETKSGDTIVC